MMDPSKRDVGSVLVEFARILAEDRSAESILRALGDYCTELFEVAAIGVLLLEEGSLTVATANSTIGDRAEHLEVQLDEGPCLDCVRTGEHVIVPDLREALDRYPVFGPQAIDAGIVGIHALPLSARSDLVGALDIITTEVRELSAEDLRVADMLADVAVSYLVSVEAHRQANELASQLQNALDTRIVIEQAKGLLAERHQVPINAAFERIRVHARSTNRRARDIAQEVVEGRLDV